MGHSWAPLPPPHPHSSGQVPVPAHDGRPYRHHTRIRRGRSPVPAPPRAAGGQGRMGQPPVVAPTLAILRVAGSPRRWRGSPGAGRPLVPATAASSYNGVNIPMFKCNDSATVRCTVSPASSPLTLAPSSPATFLTCNLLLPPDCCADVVLQAAHDLLADFGDLGIVKGAVRRTEH